MPCEFRKLPSDPSLREFPGAWKLPLLRLPSWDGSLSLTLLSLFLSFIFFPTSFQRRWAAFLGAMSSASGQKLFCEVCSAFKCSFDEFVGEKVVSPSYPSAILAPSFIYLDVEFRCSLNMLNTYPLTDIAFANISFHSIDSFLLIVSCCAEILNLM